MSARQRAIDARNAARMPLLSELLQRIDEQQTFLAALLSGQSLLMAALEAADMRADALQQRIARLEDLTSDGWLEMTA